VKRFEPHHAACGFLICSKNCFGFMMARDFSRAFVRTRSVALGSQPASLPAMLSSRAWPSWCASSLAAAPQSRCVLFQFSRAVHCVSPDRVAVVTIHHSGREEQQGNSSTISHRPAPLKLRIGAIGGCCPFLYTRQNSSIVIETYHPSRAQNQSYALPGAPWWLLR
jgi:hypothetical protein